METDFNRTGRMLVAACLVLLMTCSTLALGAPGAGQGPRTDDLGGGPAPITALASKADPALKERLAEDPGGLQRVLVAGPPHADLKRVTSSDRRDAHEQLSVLSAGFFEHVTDLVRHREGQVHETYPTAPAVFLSADPGTLALLAALDSVKEIALVEDGSVWIRSSGPAPGVPPVQDPAPGGPETRNSEGRAMMQADDAWALGFRGAGVRVASIDTGVDPDHEAFRNEDGTSRIVSWADCSSGSCDASGLPFDDHGHGTFTAASAVGSAEYDDPENGTFEESGSAPEAELVAVKFLSSTGGGTFAGALASIERAFVNDADITLNAWGSSSCVSANQALYDSIMTTTQLGMLSVFAVGGGGPGEGTVGFPACMEATIAIGAVDAQGEARSSSARGPCTDPGTGEVFLCPDAMALGQSVRSAAPRGTCSLCDPSGYRVLSGTSAATGLATGYFAVAEGIRRDVTGSPWDTASRAEREVLNLSAKDLGPEGPDNTYGYGLPQLLDVYALVNASDEAVILDRFEISDPEVHMGQTTTLLFSVRNLGNAEATGDFMAELVHSDGGVETLADEEVTLGLLQGHGVTHAVTAAGDVPPGDYTFRASFDYSWTNGTGEQKTGSVEHEGTFIVHRVFLEMELEGLSNETAPGSVQSLLFDLSSIGSAPARHTTLEFTVPDAYIFLPGDGFDPMEPTSQYADPPPDRVIQMSNPERTVLVWDVGDLSPGQSFSFSTELLAKQLGDHRFMAVAKYEDDGGGSWSQVEVFRQIVAV